MRNIGIENRPRVSDRPASGAVARDLGWLTTFQEGVSSATGTAACVDVFLACLESFDIDCFACGEIDLDDRRRTVFHAISWPDDWRQFYFSSGLVERDPLLEALATRREPFTWSDLTANPTLPAETRRTFRDVAKAGWTEGLVVPIGRGASRVGLVSMAAKRQPFSAEEKALLALASVFFHQRIRDLARVDGFAAPPAGLTGREIECLAMVAEGLSDREIGERLGIAGTTAHEHVERAKRKLGARTRAAAAALAVSLGIVEF